MNETGALDDVVRQNSMMGEAPFDPASENPGSMSESVSSQAEEVKKAVPRPLPFDVPDSYGDNKIMLMVRDPWTIFSYWETNNDVENKVREDIADRGLTISKSVLRVYDMTDVPSTDDARIAFDFELKGWISSWYVHGDPGRSWMADIGILCTNGEFFRIARSNVVSTPANKMSEITDAEWMCPEELYYKLFKAAGGDGIGRSSLRISELMERHLRKWLSSGGGVTSSLFGSSSFHLDRR